MSTTNILSVYLQKSPQTISTTFAEIMCDDFWGERRRVDKKFKLLELFCMVLLVAVGFFGASARAICYNFST